MKIKLINLIFKLAKFNQNIKNISLIHGVVIVINTRVTNISFFDSMPGWGINIFLKKATFHEIFEIKNINSS